MNNQRVEVQETIEWGFQNAKFFIMLKCEWMKVSVCTLTLAILREAHTTTTTTKTWKEALRSMLLEQAMYVCMYVCMGITFETLFSLMLEQAMYICMYVCMHALVYVPMHIKILKRQKSSSNEAHQINYLLNELFDFLKTILIPCPNKDIIEAM